MRSAPRAPREPQSPRVYEERDRLVARLDELEGDAALLARELYLLKDDLSCAWHSEPGPAKDEAITYPWWAGSGLPIGFRSKYSKSSACRACAAVCRARHGSVRIRMAHRQASSRSPRLASSSGRGSGRGPSLNLQPGRLFRLRLRSTNDARSWKRWTRVPGRGGRMLPEKVKGGG